MTDERWSIVDEQLVLGAPTEARVKLAAESKGAVPGIRAASSFRVDALLMEWTQYTVSAAAPIRRVHGLSEFQVLPGVPTVGTFKFQNRVGRAQLIVELETGMCPPLSVEVLSHKFRTEGEHQAMLEALLVDLTRHIPLLRLPQTRPRDSLRIPICVRQGSSLDSTRCSRARTNYGRRFTQ